jgi:fumarate reductase subunit D
MDYPHFDHNQDIIEGKPLALLSYLSILCILPLIFKKENEFVLRHAKQGLIIFVGEVAVFIAHIVLGVWVLKLGMFILGVMSFVGIIYVLRGLYVELPFVTEIADKITL